MGLNSSFQLNPALCAPHTCSRHCAPHTCAFNTVPLTHAQSTLCPSHMRSQHCAPHTCAINTVPLTHAQSTLCPSHMRSRHCAPHTRSQHTYIKYRKRTCTLAHIKERKKIIHTKQACTRTHTHTNKLTHAQTCTFTHTHTHTTALRCSNKCRVGQNRIGTCTVNRKLPYILLFPCQKYHIYTVYIWFWPTLHICMGTPRFAHLHFTKCNTGGCGRSLLPMHLHLAPAGARELVTCTQTHTR